MHVSSSNPLQPVVQPVLQDIPSHEMPVTQKEEVTEGRKPEASGDEQMTKAERTRIIALKALAIAAIVLGSVLAVGGAAALTFTAVALGIMPMLFAAGLMMGTPFLYLSVLLAYTPITALGLLFTLPIAGVAYALPISLPAMIGAAPGIGLIALGTWGWNVISTKS